jgi:hypothetical protein
MGDVSEQIIEFLTDLPPRKEIEAKMAETTCIHEIFAEWCSICKYEGESSAKQMLLERNLKIVENILKWPSRLKK